MLISNCEGIYKTNHQIIFNKNLEKGVFNFYLHRILFWFDIYVFFLKGFFTKITKTIF
jgi:hypothetical protein